MAYLIDGSNLIGYISPEHLRDPKTKRSLLSHLRIFQRFKRTKVYVVFDGTPDLELIEKDLQKKALSVLFPDIDENADLVIKRMIEKQTDLRRFYVVSSDREIRTFAKEKGAKSLHNDEFLKLLRSVLKRYKKTLEAKKEDISLSPLEVDQWLHIFEDKK